MNAITPIPAVAETGEFQFVFDDVLIKGRVTDGNAWIVAGEVAKSLGHREAADITRLLDEDEKATHIVQTPGGPQAVSFISEAGLFKVILQRRTIKKLPCATKQRIERFQRLVFHEVLPAIQRTGTYTAPTAQPAVTAVGMLEALKDPATVIALIEHHARETLTERAAHAVTHQRLEESNAKGAALQAQVEADRPAVLAQQRIGAAKGELLLSDVAVTVGVDRIRIVEWLVSLGFLRRGGDRRLRCTREGRLSGWVRGTAEVAEEPTAEESGRCRIRITGTGLRALSEHFCRGASATSQDVIPGF